MNFETTVITTVDYERLKVLLANEFTRALSRLDLLNRLEDKLNEPKIVSSLEIAPHVITMNSTFRLRDLKTGDAQTYTLVYPNEANIAEGKLSILTPLGIEALGRGANEEVVCRVQDYEDVRLVESVSFQPERKGAFNL